ncbi:unnamed protein product [Polarella glacialis]|uniref:Uncharacterized protein n=1 Tax=Polarella glacialis TaxID=89957 RepID=A0A813HCQ1_POLGL|nr:unnamed protein product [Polarella glacialis]
MVRNMLLRSNRSSPSGTQTQELDASCTSTSSTKSGTAHPKAAHDNNTNNHNYNNEAASLLSKIRGIAYDSAPVRVAPPVLATGFSAMLAGRLGFAPESPAARHLAPAAELIFAGLMRLSGREQLCSELYEELRLQTAVPHLLLYSGADEVIPSASVLRFSEELKEQGGSSQLEEFAGSPHVMHFRRYPERYAETVKRFLDTHL